MSHGAAAAEPRRTRAYGPSTEVPRKSRQVRACRLRKCGELGILREAGLPTQQEYWCDETTCCSFISVVTALLGCASVQPTRRAWRDVAEIVESRVGLADGVPEKQDAESRARVQYRVAEPTWRSR